ncbi:unnamed protein product [Amoebophrya sp. A120]|nr:unnamed protein product [Amoebophrya sp. A120]|eukprot:GSA120T00009714001.1
MAPTSDKKGTAHIGADITEIAEICLVPGDPLRAKYIVENYLEDYKQVTSVRNCLGYTGYYNGVRLSVVASGMGAAGASIYFSELIDYYNVKVLIRIGSCGTHLAPKVKMGDLILAMTAGTDSKMNRTRLLDHDHAVCCDFELLKTCTESCDKILAENAKNENYHVGKIFTSDFFYHPQEQTLYPLLKKHNYLGIEMECSSLYACASERNARALTICTVTDEIHLVDNTGPNAASTPYKLEFKGLSSAEREQKLRSMMQIALDTVVKTVHKGL